MNINFSLDLLIFVLTIINNSPDLLLPTVKGINDSHELLFLILRFINNSHELLFSVLRFINNSHELLFSALRFINNSPELLFTALRFINNLPDLLIFDMMNISFYMKKLIFIIVFINKSFFSREKILILRTKKHMEPIRLKKISVDDIYVSILTKRRVTNAEGWTRMEPVGRQIKPTGSMVMDAVAKALAENCGLTSKDLAKAMEITKRDLHAVFRLLTGMQASDFLKQYRQKRACEWLACTDLTVIKIAPLSGYTSPEAMVHYFTEHLKCTPLEYRQLHRPKNFRELYEWETKS